MTLGRALRWVSAAARTADSIYTERFMLMPQNNPEGYAKGSVIAAAKNLHGVPLLIHGVH